MYFFQGLGLYPFSLQKEPLALCSFILTFFYKHRNNVLDARIGFFYRNHATTLVLDTKLLHLHLSGYRMHNYTVHRGIRNDGQEPWRSSPYSECHKPLALFFNGASI